MEFAVLRITGQRLVSQLPLLREVRQGRLLQWNSSPSAAAGRVEASPGSLSGPLGRYTAGSSAVPGLGGASQPATRLADGVSRWEVVGCSWLPSRLRGT